MQIVTAYCDFIFDMFSRFTSHFIYFGFIFMFYTLVILSLKIVKMCFVRERGVENG